MQPFLGRLHINEHQCIFTASRIKNQCANALFPTPSGFSRGKLEWVKIWAINKLNCIERSLQMHTNPLLTSNGFTGVRWNTFWRLFSRTNQVRDLVSRAYAICHQKTITILLELLLYIGPNFIRWSLQSICWNPS